MQHDVTNVILEIDVESETERTSKVISKHQVNLAALNVKTEVKRLHRDYVLAD